MLSLKANRAGELQSEDLKVVSQLRMKFCSKWIEKILNL
jgi:hypothetical protein